MGSGNLQRWGEPIFILSKFWLLFVACLSVFMRVQEKGAPTRKKYWWEHLGWTPCHQETSCKNCSWLALILKKLVWKSWFFWQIFFGWVFLHKHKADAGKFTQLSQLCLCKIHTFSHFAKCCTYTRETGKFEQKLGATILVKLALQESAWLFVKHGFGLPHHLCLRYALGKCDSKVDVWGIVI